MSMARIKTDILVSSLLVVVAFIAAGVSINAKNVTYDGALYIDIARNLLHGITNYTYQGYYMMYRPPGYVYTLYLVFHLTPLSPSSLLTTAKLVSALFYGLTAGLVYYFALAVWGDRIKAVGASVLYMANPLAFSMATRGLVHSEFTFFYTLSLYLLYTGRRLGDRRLIYASFVVAGVSILTRYTGLSILAVIFTYLYLTEYWGWTKKKEYGVGAILTLLVLTPWLYLGRLHYGGALMPFSTATKYVTHAPPVSAFDYISSLTSVLGIILLLTLLGIVLLKQNEEGWLLISWFLIGFTGILTVTHKENRFVTFLSPVMAILSTHALWRLGEWTRALVNWKERRTLTPAVFMVLLVLVLIPTVHSAIAMVNMWDERGSTYVTAFDYARMNYPASWILVSQKVYTIAGLYYPHSTIQIIIPRQQVRERVKNGRYDLIVRLKSDPNVGVLESGRYREVKEFGHGTVQIFTRLS
ncbi:glycosyltransferase family 39 protein [Thermococcus sp.]|uniref:ArnT family glycosyltransferase n=1 Tax=Thermococcus sp. TaxID=35749 RepID=UPI002619DAF2|nr:glycosyltransferase family 39 protein [Thermococcus sp.]